VPAGTRFDPLRSILDPGVDETVTAFARDGAGRLWLGGKGLWVMGTKNRAVAVHPQLPFMVDAVARNLAFVDGKLVLSLGDRGAAIVDPATLASQAHER
jgi:hypothetical protein